MPAEGQFHPTASSDSFYHTERSGGKKIPSELVNLIHVAVQLQDAGAWHKGGGGNKCLSMRKGFLQQLEFLLL